MQLATIQALANYWTTDYDWRACEARLNALPQRSWVENSYPNVTHFNEVDRGGHFAAWEEPELFAAEMRAAFSSLRWVTAPGSLPCACERPEGARWGGA